MIVSALKKKYPILTTGTNAIFRKSLKSWIVQPNSSFNTSKKITWQNSRLDQYLECRTRRLFQQNSRALAIVFEDFLIIIFDGDERQSRVVVNFKMLL